MKTAMNPRVDFYFSNSRKWQQELGQLRAYVLDCGLTEELKWGSPTYTHQGGNVALLHEFRDYCAVLFFKGVLLSDPNGALVRQTENTQAARQLRFASVQEVAEAETLVKSYIREAVEIEKSGLQVALKRTADFALPEEFQSALHDTPGLQAAFDALTPGRQRAYLLHFAAPKQAKTRQQRVAKASPQILRGQGLND